jgi:hypothetical protein
MGLSTSHFVLMILIKVKANDNKKEISHFRAENFLKLIAQLQQKQPNDAYSNRFKTKHPRYFSILKQHEKIISASIENYQPNNYEQLLLSIIVFNDNYTTRWSTKTNYFQLKIFYDLCLKLQTKAK